MAGNPLLFDFPANGTNPWRSALYSVPRYIPSTAAILGTFTTKYLELYGVLRTSSMVELPPTYTSYRSIQVVRRN
jgi:hypothetical protein